MDINVDLKDILNNYKKIYDMYKNSIDILNNITIYVKKKDSLEDKLYYTLNKIYYSHNNNYMSYLQDNNYMSYDDLMSIYDVCEVNISNLKKNIIILIEKLIKIDIDINSKNSLEFVLKNDKDYYPVLFSCKKRILKKIKDINAYNLFIKGTKDTTIELYILDSQYDVFSIIKNYLL